MAAPEARIHKEFRDLKRQGPSAGIVATLVNDDARHWKGTIKGPSETVYESGSFVIDIVIPTTYPFEPPKMRFDTRVWHPNISSQTGAICLDILKSEWSPALTIRTALLSIQALLSAPEPDDPQDAQVAQQYKRDRPAWERKARDWTQMYAAGKVDETKQSSIQQLTDMGFDTAAATAALEAHEWDVGAATEFLLSH